MDDCLRREREEEGRLRSLIASDSSSFEGAARMRGPLFRICPLSEGLVLPGRDCLQ